MHYDTIDTKNKIISTKDLQEIFEKMGETLRKYKRISEQEEIKNYSIESYNRVYSYKDEGSKMKFTVDFYDSTQVTFDTYESFMGVFYNRVNEMKMIDVYFYLSYSIKQIEPVRKHDYFSQSIKIHIREKRMDLDINLKSEDPKLDDVYNLIKEKVLTAPERYDDVISKKNSIINTISFSKGLIPAVIVSLVFLLVPFINNIIFNGYIVFPAIALLLAYLIGNMLSINKLENLYAPIVPDKKYAGHDSNYKSIYKDDLETFVGESEILIGKKVNNLENREKIREEYRKAKKNMPIGLIVLAIASIVVIIIGLFM